MVIDKDIFRIGITIPDGVNLNLFYEHELRQPFSILFKAGTNVDYRIAEFNGGVPNWYIHAFSSSEIRYYYSLNKRFRLNRPVRNFTAGYFSLEPYFRSNQLAAINDIHIAKGGSMGSFLNWGYQGQYKNHFFTAFVGALLLSKDLSISTYPTTPSKISFGLTYGYVF